MFYTRGKIHRPKLATENVLSIKTASRRKLYTVNISRKNRTIIAQIIRTFTDVTLFYINVVIVLPIVRRNVSVNENADVAKVLRT